jgi:hypothetical protein
MIDICCVSVHCSQLCKNAEAFLNTQCKDTATHDRALYLKQAAGAPVDCPICGDLHGAVTADQHEHHVEKHALHRLKLLNTATFHSDEGSQARCHRKGSQSPRTHKQGLELGSAQLGVLGLLGLRARNSNHNSRTDAQVYYYR